MTAGNLFLCLNAGLLVAARAAGDLLRRRGIVFSLVLASSVACGAFVVLAAGAARIAVFSRVRADAAGIQRGIAERLGIPCDFAPVLPQPRGDDDPGGDALWLGLFTDGAAGGGNLLFLLGAGDSAFVCGDSGAVCGGIRAGEVFAGGGEPTGAAAACAGGLQEPGRGAVRFDSVFSVWQRMVDCGMAADFSDPAIGNQSGDLDLHAGAVLGSAAGGAGGGEGALEERIAWETAAEFDCAGAGGLHPVDLHDEQFGANTGILLLGGGFASIYPLVVERIGHRFTYYHPGLYNGIFSFAFTGGLLAPFLLGYLAQWWGVGAIWWCRCWGALWCFCWCC